MHREKNNQRYRLLQKARKRHFRNANTSILEAQFAEPSITTSDEDIKPPAPRQYGISERGDIIRLTCEPIADSADHGTHAQRLETIRVRVALCGRQESRHRAQPGLPPTSTETTTSLGNSEKDTKDRFPLVCKPTQCIFCLGNESKSYPAWMFQYAKPHKMMNEVEKCRTFSHRMRCPVRTQIARQRSGSSRASCTSRITRRRCTRSVYVRSLCLQ